MKSQLVLHIAIIEDIFDGHGYSSSRDTARVIARVEKEGLSFLTLALPRLADQLHIGLRDGRLPRFPGWATKDSLPLLFNRLWRGIFDSSGSLLCGPDVPAHVASLRQILLFQKKPKELCAPVYLSEALKSYKDLEQNYPTGYEHDARIGQVFYDLFGRKLEKYFRHAYSDDTFFFGKHGPGAVAERLNLIERWDFPIIPEKAYDVFGAATFDPLYENKESRSCHVPARMIYVPKTARKPRIISAEPAALQFVQQGMESIFRKVLSGTNADYRDQTRNQHLAERASTDGHLATVDLSEASDRVGLGLVKAAFRRLPYIHSLLLAARTPFVELPNSEIIALKKFAGMGSALTFPLQCMIFMTIVEMARQDTMGKGRGHSALYSTHGYSVYGDDIIVPVRVYPRLVELLTYYGLKVNVEKSYSTGLFRESCGFDGYMGVNVTPIYLRYPLDDRRDASIGLSLLATRNFLLAKGYSRCATVLDRHFWKYFPQIAATGCPGDFPADAGLHRDQPVHRWNKHLQTHQYKTVVLVDAETHPVEGDSALLKANLHRINGGVSQAGALRYWRPRAPKLNSRWRSLYCL